MIPAQVERRARWVLDSIGATELGFGDDVPYDANAWEQVERGERPESDEVAAGFHGAAGGEEIVEQEHALVGTDGIAVDFERVFAVFELVGERQLLRGQLAGFAGGGGWHGNLDSGNEFSVGVIACRA